MNPIEHAWDTLQRRISARQRKPSTRPELAVALAEELARIPQRDIQKLITSFRTRLRAVIRARGGHTRF